MSLLLLFNQSQTVVPLGIASEESVAIPVVRAPAPPRKLTAEEVSQVYFLAGVVALMLKDFSGAHQALAALVTAGILMKIMSRLPPPE